MIYIDPKSTKIKEALEKHKTKIMPILVQNTKSLSLRQKQFIHQKIYPNIDTILIGNPLQIFNFSTKINLGLLESNNKAIQKMFNYDNWRKKKKKKYDAYELAKLLNISSCVYCNRNYTSTVVTDKKIKVTRPQFDHFFSQKDHPVLALSFYNLIPSCYVCNSNIKGDTPLYLDRHHHPYIERGEDDFRFSFKFDTTFTNNLKVKLRDDGASIKSNNTNDFFKTEDVYNAHTDELNDLFEIKEKYGDKYLDILSKSVLNGTKIGKEELYKLAFGVYLEEEKFMQRPFSKFKKDILIELGIINNI